MVETWRDGTYRNYHIHNGRDAAKRVIQMNSKQRDTFNGYAIIGLIGLSIAIILLVGMLSAKPKTEPFCPGALTPPAEQP